MFNLSLSQQYFLTLWKQVAIIPVLKKGKSTSVSNYRPIALLCQLFQDISNGHS
jgi:hypothetical protein